MDIELEDKLVKAFPNLFSRIREIAAVEKQFFGCACGDGWFTLVYSVCALMNGHTTSAAYKGPAVKILQIKEKFGALRIYYEGGDDYINGAVDLAEMLSTKICDVTGAPGTLCRKPSGWLQTLCPAEAEKLQAHPYTWPRKNALPAMN